MNIRDVSEIRDQISKAFSTHSKDERSEHRSGNASFPSCKYFSLSYDKNEQEHFTKEIARNDFLPQQCMRLASISRRLLKMLKKEYFELSRAKRQGRMGDFFDPSFVLDPVILNY